MAKKIENIMQIVRNTENSETEQGVRMNIMARKMLRKYGVFAI